MRRLHALLAVGAVVVASPALTWFLLGDVSETDVADPDYLFRPPGLSPFQEGAIGFGALTIAAVGTAVVVVALRRELVSAREVVAAAPLVAAGAFVGLAARVVTAAVDGANIGGGLVLLFGPFIVLGLVVLAAVLWVRRLR